MKTASLGRKGSDRIYHSVKKHRYISPKCWQRAVLRSRMIL